MSYIYVLTATGIEMFCVAHFLCRCGNKDQVIMLIGYGAITLKLAMLALYAMLRTQPST